MKPNIDLYMEMLGIESTSGMERALSERLAQRLKTPGCTLTRYEVGDGTENLLFAWGDPQIVFCTHMDTVPPFIPPTVEELPDGDLLFKGRGTCDAKGQIIALYTACLELEARGCTGFGLLLLSGEETGSFGAKAFRTQHPGGRVVIVGEPTDGCMASASKGTKSFGLTFRGVSSHSGYPENGASAVERFVDFASGLRTADIPSDPVLGETTWNIGKLVSDNPQNILSDRLDCRIYFRTTFASDAAVCEMMKTVPHAEVTVYGGDTPMEYLTLDGFRTKAIAFGSDAPQLTNYESKILCGPGSILVAHRPEECIRLSELQEAADNYVEMYNKLK